VVACLAADGPSFEAGTISFRQLALEQERGRKSLDEGDGPAAPVVDGHFYFTLKDPDDQEVTIYDAHETNMPAVGPP